MKKLFALLLIAGCGVSFVGCGGETKPPAKPEPAPMETPKPDGEGPVAPPTTPTDPPPPATPGDAPAAPAPAPAEAAPAAPAEAAPK